MCNHFPNNIPKSNESKKQNVNHKLHFITNIDNDVRNIKYMFVLVLFLYMLCSVLFKINYPLLKVLSGQKE